MSDDTNGLVTPVPDRLAGTVLPGGRGYEQHGVPMDGAPELVDAVEAGDTIHYPDPPAAQEPVPVRVVNERVKERRQFRTSQHPAKRGEVTQVVGLNENRTALRITNVGPETVWLASEMHTASPQHGVPLAVNGVFTTEAETPVWCFIAASAATDTSWLAIFHEYSVGTN